MTFTVAAMASAVPTARAEDAYIESAGTSGISTGYRMKGASRLEVDFAMVDGFVEQARIAGSDAQEASLQTVLYVSGGKTHFGISAHNGTSSSTKYKAGTDTLRHTAIIDLPRSMAYFVTGGTTNLSESYNFDFTGREADKPLPLFGRYSNGYGTAFNCFAKTRIYGVKIFENDLLVRNFVPCLKDGTACFKDMVTGGFIVGEDVSSFTAGGDVPTYQDDGYISTAANVDGGKLYVDTGYTLTPNTAVAFDCAPATATSPGDYLLYGGDNNNMFNLYYSRNRLGWSMAKNNWKDLGDAFPERRLDVRRTYVLDGHNMRVSVLTSGYTNITATASANGTPDYSAWTLKLGANYIGNSSYVPLKIYGCKIWESGELVRDLVPYINYDYATGVAVPGLRDSLTGTFIPGSRNATDTVSEFAYGGVVDGEQDAYLESNGTTGISTGYRMKGTSRMVVDFSMADGFVEQARIAGSDAREPSLQTVLYVAGGKTHFAMFAYNGTSSSTKYKAGTDTMRHTAIIDLPRSMAYFVTGGTTNLSQSYNFDFTGREADKPLPLFGRYSNDAGTSFDCCAKARIYSVRIYESDALVREFLPYGGNGVSGFYDTVTGEVVSNGSSFTFGGKGQDHGQLKAYIKPGYAKQIDSKATTTLTAYAPGATSYRWLMDGEPVAGGTDGVFEVSWARGGTKTEQGYCHTYQAIAVFGDFYGATRESEPTAAAAVTSLPRGLVISVY